jgi:hypothetical protein
MMATYWELLHSAETVEPSADMTTYDLPPEAGAFEVGANFDTHGRDPDDDPKLTIFLACARYVHPRPDETTEWRFSAQDHGRDVVWFWAGGGRRDALSLEPVLLPDDRESEAYASVVRGYVESACELIRRERQRLVGFIAGS